ncbi:MAG: hypothetical protein HC915_16955 [Anaerolineae bacterium]|nr:hypothetical protein [Anaerolineae bacterium]
MDSGGTGLMYIAEGMLKHLRGEELASVLELDSAFERAMRTQDRFEQAVDPGAERYNYDVQFVLKGETWKLTASSRY